jgi:NAD(P)-dependent dehydrogenase (short-subunit alcohol dehydrogenase family)
MSSFLQDKVALVTGGTSGIDIETAHAFTRQEVNIK